MGQFNDFLNEVEQAHKNFAEELHDIFLRVGCKVKIEKKAAGFFVAFSNPETKRSVSNFYFRKNGLHVRLYPEFYSSKIILTDYMVSEIDKAANCTRLRNTAECNPKCIMGYDFELRGKHYQKCRYCSFQFLVTDESKPVIMKWVVDELGSNT